MTIKKFLLIGALCLGMNQNSIANTLPLQPGSPNIVLNSEKDGKPLTFIFWRDSSGVNLFMKITAVNGGDVFICGSSFSLLQNGIKFDSLQLNSGDSAKKCHVFKNEKTFTFAQANSVNQLNNQQALSVEFDNIAKIDIPAFSGSVMTTTTVEENLNIHMTSATFQTAEGELNIRANLEFKGVNEKGEYIWKLKDYEVNQ